MKKVEDQFWGKVEKRAKEKCWLWLGARNNAGYGNIRVNKKYTNAHRISWLIHFGDIKKGFVICHKCDNPPCVNPYHLFTGRPRDNDADKVRKNRHIYGMKHPRSKLTDEQVLEIRAINGTHQTIADKYDISRRLVGMIKKRDIWNHLSKD